MRTHAHRATYRSSSPQSAYMGDVPKHKIAATCRKWISDIEVVIVVCTIAICNTLAVCSVHAV